MANKQVTSINGMGAITLNAGVYTTTGMRANDHMQVSEDFVNQAGVVGTSDFVVTQNGTPGKNVLVAGGTCYVLNSNYSALSLTEQKYWRVKMDASEVVTIADNTSGNPRIDIICVKIDTTATPNGDATNVATLVAVQGTPGASPAVPATPANYLKLCEVAVANGFSSILNANITDRRVISGLSDNNGGWTPILDTWAYASADSTVSTYTITVPSGAATKYWVGMKVKLTQSTVKYFIITAVADTLLTVYGGTDYTLTNATIVSPYISTVKAPSGFPMSPVKWRQRYISSSDVGITVGTTWTQMTGAQLAIPIGVWNVSYTLSTMDMHATLAIQTQRTLSTTTNSVSDADFTSTMYLNLIRMDLMLYKTKILEIAAKTTYYLLAISNNTNTTVTDRGATNSPTIIDAVCAYL